MDTGIRYTHEDLRDNILVNLGEIPDNGKDDDNNGLTDDYYGYDFADNDSDPWDYRLENIGHGTHVAGTIGADSNGKGVIGSNPAAKMIAVRVFSATGGTSLGRLISGLDYSVSRGAKVINMSLGGQGSFSSEYYAACKRVTDAGVLIIRLIRQ